MPSNPIECSYAGPGLLARIVTAKFAEHTSYYRQSEIYRRQGVELSAPGQTGPLVWRAQRTAGAAVCPTELVRADAG